MKKQQTLADVASKGGHARAESLTAEERSEIAKRAVEARWGKKVLKATHAGEITIGDIVLPCAVLEDGTRVISQRGMSTALGRVTTGSGTHYTRKSEENGVARMPTFISGKAIKPFVDAELTASLTNPIEYLPIHGGRTAYGFAATLVPKICEVWLKARNADKLSPQQEHIAERAHTLIMGLAELGIVALVDEATGYQYERPRRDLEEQLKKFLSESLRKWVRTFPADYFKHLCRLKGVELRPDMRLPLYFGILTNNLIYRRIAPGLLKKLKERRIEKGRPNEKLHLGLSLDIGVPEVLVHLGTVVGLMKIHDDYDKFVDQLDEIAPIYPETPGLFDNPKDWDKGNF